MPASLGLYTQSVLLKDFHGNDIHEEFLVATAPVHVGQPLVMNTTGTVSPAGATTAPASIVGYATQDRGIGELVTVNTKFRAIIYAASAAVQNAGGVKYSAFSPAASGGLVIDSDVTAGVSGLSVYAIAATPAEIQAFALDPATAANEIIRVGIF